MSRVLFQDGTVNVKGFSWCLRTFKSIPLDALVSNILCEEHNNELSIVDAGAKAVWDAFRECERLHGVRVSIGRKRWTTRRIPVPGALLERWCIKTAINLISSRGAEGPWSLKGDASTHPPVKIVEAAFGRSRLSDPLGLYLAAEVGAEHRVEDHVGFEVIEDPPNPFAGATFLFSGFRFLIWLHNSDPSSGDSPLRRLEGYEGVEHMYRGVGIHFSTTSERLEFKWS
jgi:hypothetical protein